MFPIIPAGSTGPSSGSGTGLCRDTELLPAVPGGRGQTLCDLLEHKDVPITFLARTHCTEGSLDLQTPSAGVLGAPHSSPHS